MSIDLDAIEARIAAATPGPWHWRNTGEPMLVGDRSYLVMGFRRMGMNGAQPQFRDEHNIVRDAGRKNINDFPDADLIAHAPTDLAALLAELRATTADLAVAVEVARERGEEVERLSRRIGMTRDNAADDLAELRAENERLRAVAEAAWALTGDPDNPAWRKLSAALDAWRAGGGA